MAEFAAGTLSDKHWINQFVETQFVSVLECQSVIIIHLQIFVKLLQAAPTR